MEKANWKNDTELLLMLSERGTAPVAVPSPLFDSQYEFIVKTNSHIIKKQFVPKWALDIVCKILDSDENVKSYFYRLTYKGNIK